MRDLRAHEKWVVENAEYWTAVRFHNRAYERHEQATQRGVERLAKRMVAKDPEARFMIYAVHGLHSVWVNNIMGKT